MHELVIREERRGDREAVRAVLERAFGRPDEAGLVERLHADGDVVAAFIAVADGDVAGHLLFSPLEIANAPFPVAAAALAPLAVLPDRQRLGIGSALVRRGLAACREAGVDAVFVLGDAAYYRRFGFSSVPAARFASPFPGDAFMALALRIGALEEAAGAVRYAAAFGLGR